MKLPEHLSGNEAELDALLAQPTPALIDFVSRLDGDLIILGIAGKIGVSLGMQAVNAIRAAGVKKRVIGVSRFSDAAKRAKLEANGIETISCDLIDPKAVAELPQVENVIFMAGRKFGTQGSEGQTWAMNVLAPANVGSHFRQSRIVAFSTGCVYPLVGVETCGCTEEIPPAPVGDYSQSCLGRERIFEFCAAEYGARILLFRLNYSVDMRYGVLNDIARPVWEGRPVSNSAGWYNVIWQGDATAAAIRSLGLAAAPAAILNVTGPETASTEQTARLFGKLFGKPVTFTADAAGNRCYLNNAAKMCRLFGYPTVPLDQLIRWQADWIQNGGIDIGKPTHFEVNNGKF